jgi:hypothetical protein
MNYKTFIAVQAVDFMHQWGRDAAKRFLMKRTGYNEATALRVIQAVKLCKIMEKVAC